MQTFSPTGWLRCGRTIVVALASLGLSLNAASAHEGPPFPILMDQPAAGYRVSVWADPDIGEAFFYVILETPEGLRPATVPKVSLWTQPVGGRLDRVTYEATQQDLKSHLQFEVEPYFDQGEMWDVGIQIERPDHTAGELITQVEATPPGYGPWDLAIYLFPFVLLAGMWVVAVMRRMRYDPQSEVELPLQRGDSTQAQCDVAVSASKD